MILQLTAIDAKAETPEEQMAPVYVAADKVVALRTVTVDNPLAGATDADGNFRFLDEAGVSTIPETFQATLILTPAGSFAVTEDVTTVLALMQQNVHISAPGAGANPKVN